MFKRRSAKDVKFYGVALFFIIAGVALLSFGAVQWVGMMMWDWQYGWPLAKVMGGMVICAMGYIVLCLELIRHKQ